MSADVVQYSDWNAQAIMTVGHPGTLQLLYRRRSPDADGAHGLPAGRAS